MEIIKNSVINGQHQKPIVLDVFYTKNNQPKAIVIFSHGYKGYKDWGCWNLVAQHFAKNNLFFVKFNFSHNGGTVDQPIDFPDLEAFAENNYTKELDDLQSVIDWIVTESSFTQEIDTSNITVIGHSRAGGIVTIKANEDHRITKVISWGGVSDYASRFPKGASLKKWKKEGVYYVANGRTKQQMPHYFQYFENFIENKQRLNIKRAVTNLKIPYLIIHGTDDESVGPREAKQLHSWSSKSDLFLIKNGNHTFNSKQPWKSLNLPPELKKVIDVSISFISS